MITSESFNVHMTPSSVYIEGIVLFVVISAVKPKKVLETLLRKV